VHDDLDSSRYQMVRSFCQFVPSLLVRVPIQFARLRIMRLPDDHDGLRKYLFVS
jgi:hypothetical protein